MNGTCTGTLSSSQDFSPVFSTKLQLDHAPAVEFDLPPGKPVEAPQSDTSPSFGELCGLEPRLLTLYNCAKAIRDNKRMPSFCANHVWYGRGNEDGFKERLVELVGWRVKRRGGDVRLATSRAYDVAYRTVYDALPDCRNCVCSGFQRIIDERLGR